MVDRRRFLSGSLTALGWGLAAPFTLNTGACGGGGASVRQGADAGMAGDGAGAGDTAGVARPPAVLRLDSERVFDLSVASGDPTASGVILWTHIRPERFAPEIPLWFQVADEPGFQRVRLEGLVAMPATGPGSDHTVKVDLDGRLEAGRSYHYRFIYGDTASQTGRCRTLPARGTSPAEVKLAVLTCQDYTNGYYGAYRHVAEDDSIDFLVHLGDFIYESVDDERFQETPFPDRLLTLPIGGHVATGLGDYRFLYRNCRSDPSVRRALERHTLIAAPDDHETANDCYWDYANDTLGAPDHPFKGDAARLRRLKLDSQRAWCEYMPTRVAFDPLATHPHQASRLYRTFVFGDLVRLSMLDTRSYRTAHPCGEGDVLERYLPLGCEKYETPTQTILGKEQRAWLLDELTSPGQTWKVLGNQTFFGRLSAVPNGGLPINLDAWDGFGAERSLLTAEINRRAIENLVILNGDLHSSIASHVRADDGSLFTPASVVGVEFMTPAVTSAALTEMLAKGIGRAAAGTTGLSEAAVRLNNPHIRFFNSALHGYSTVRFTPTGADWTAYAVDKTVADPSRTTSRAFVRYRKPIGTPMLIEVPI
ncbi:MAG TPA: alkaline phosphatase D family protein [Polyangia bacterium]